MNFEDLKSWFIYAMLGVIVSGVAFIYKKIENNTDKNKNLEVMFNKLSLEVKQLKEDNHDIVNRLDEIPSIEGEIKLVREQVLNTARGVDRVEKAIVRLQTIMLKQ